MKIYVLRHGQTDWNLKGKIQGNTDIELNYKGIEQAKKVSEIIKYKNINIIICSPLKRTKQTAEIIKDVINCDILYEDALKERNYGIFEGLFRNDIQNSGINLDNFNNYYLNLKYKNIETIHNFCTRVWKFLDNLKIAYIDKNILLVSHGGTIRVINAYFNGIKKNGMLDSTGLNNCEILIYEI